MTTFNSQRKTNRRHAAERMGTASCGKVAWRCRKDARKAQRFHPQENLSVYQCDDCRLWHLGHLPADVAEGWITRDEWYGRDGYSPYGEIIKGMRRVLSKYGVRDAVFSRDDAGWRAVARCDGVELRVGGQPEIIAAGEALIRLRLGGE